MITPMTSAQIDVLWQLFRNGPTWDGDIVSKQGRDDLVRLNLVFRVDGWASLTKDGVGLAVTSGFDRRKEKVR